MNEPEFRLGIERILNPRAVAVIGASDDLGKFGARVFHNVLSNGFEGRLVPINPKRDAVRGVRAYARVGDIPEPIDVAVIAVPRALVFDSVCDCAAAGVGCAVIITTGFSETDAEGAALQDNIVAHAHATGMRVIGPNCLGFLNTHEKLILNSSPAMQVTPHAAGGIALISQSGALMATIYNRGVDDGAAFSVAVSIGNQADLELSDFLEYLAEHEPTRVVALYVEGFKDAKGFVQAAKRCREAGKPVLLLKAGRTGEGARVTYSHTASLATDHAVLTAVCRDAGVILVDDITGMIQAAEFFSRFGLPAGDGIGVISPSGGAAAVITDRMQDRGLRLAGFSGQTVSELSASYEPSQLGNPLDLGGLKDRSFISKGDGGLAILAREDDVAAVLIPVTTSPLIVEGNRRLAESAIAAAKPFAFILIPGSAANGVRTVLGELGVLTYETMDEGLRVLSTWCSYLELPPSAAANSVIAASNRIEPWPGGQLTEPEAKLLLEEYGIPVSRDARAGSLDEACEHAATIDYPVVLKAVSRQLIHKSEAGAVQVGIETEAELHHAWSKMQLACGDVPDGYLVCEMVNASAELLLGVKHDEQFGSVIVVGWGGVMAEVLNDVQIAVPPLDGQRALALLQQLKLWPMLAGHRGKPPLDVDATVQVICNLGRLAVDAGARLRELDVNPLMVRRAGDGVIAVDARATFVASPARGGTTSGPGANLTPKS